MQYHSVGRRWSLPVLALIASSALAAEGELWETRSSMDSPTYGRMDLGVSRDCRTPDWRDNPQFKVPGDASECRAQQMERRGDGYHWQFDCGATRGEGSARLLDGERMEAEVDMHTPEGRFTLVLASRKLGQCTLGGR